MPLQLSQACGYDVIPNQVTCGGQATKPFIDPVTNKKISFVEKGPKGAELMAQMFDVDQLEQCLGGRSSWQFDFEAYSVEMRSVHDREELRAWTRVCTCVCGHTSNNNVGSLCGVVWP